MHVFPKTQKAAPLCDPGHHTVRAHARGAASLLVLVLASLAPALAHVRPMTAEELVRESRFIVVAKVVSQTPAWNERHNAILTRYTLQIEDGLRGTPPREITLVQSGGTLDGETQATCMTVPLDTGRRYVLFLNDPLQPTFTAFTGASLGVLAESLSQTAGEPGISTVPAVFATIAGQEPVSFRGFVERLRLFVAATELSPAPAPRPPVVHDPPLPSKTFDPSSIGSVAGSVVRWAEPLATQTTSGPAPPSRPNIERLDESAGRLVPPRPDRQDYSYARSPARYIVWNELTPAFAPWSPHDQYMMSRWNSYGDIHRISGAPTGNWAWGNNRYDMTGWPSTQDMMNQFGQGWGANELAICWTRWFGSGPIVEADISMNPAFAWTLDNIAATRGSDAAWGYDVTVLHELGHSWGLAHPWESQNVWWDSVMNYAPKDYRFPNLFADDTTAIRSAYPGIGVHDGLISMYQTLDTFNNNNATYSDTFPNASQVQQMSTFNFNQSFKVENVGTDNIVNPIVDVYLTPARMNWSGYVYLQSLYYTLTMGTYSTWTLDPGSIYVPYNTPPGDYFAALWLRDPDAFSFNNEAWGSEYNSKITIRSYPWTIYPASYWQYQSVSTGPNGYYDFYFYGAGERVDISTCPSDGGGASFDTILEVYDPAFGTAAINDDACGLQSRVSFDAAISGEYHVVLKGYQGAYGSVSMGYKKRSFDSTLLAMFAGKDAGLDSIVLSWYGEVGPYDVERATVPDFSDAVRLETGTFGTQTVDPVLSDGAIYFYRVR